MRRVPRTVPGAEYYNPISIEAAGPITVEVPTELAPGWAERAVMMLMLGTCLGWASLAAAFYLAGGHFG